MDRELGICRSCEQIVPKERLPSTYEFARAMEVREADVREHRALSDCSKWPALRSDLVKMVLAWNGEFDVLKAVMNLRREPVCLECASSDVSAIPRPHEHCYGEGRSLPLGTLHLGCGGELFIRRGEGRMAFGLPVRTYDILGRLLETAEKSPYGLGRGSNGS